MRSLVIGVAGLLVPAFALTAVVVTAPVEKEPPAAHKAARRTKAPSKARELKSPVDAKLFQAASRASDHPADADAQAAYALLLAQKAREVGNAAYHVMAEQSARKALALAPRHEAALSALATALLGQHRFVDTLTLLETDKGPLTVWRLACEVDALSEIGRYEDAVRAAQRLVDLKPGPESYSRVALLRELHGDPEGALEIWGRALEACSAHGLDYAWCAAQAGDVQVRRGDFEAARAAYEASLAAQSEYYLARVGLARCSIAQGKLRDAESHLLGLAESHGDVSTLALLVDVQTALGHDDDAKATTEELIASERQSAAQGAPDPRGLALFLSDRAMDGRGRDAKSAVAMLASAGGPTVANEDARAWALLAAGNPLEARAHAKQARRTGSRNPLVLFHAGAIELALGEREAGRALLEAALAGGLRADIGAAKSARALLEQSTRP